MAVDAATLAAATKISRRVFENTGDLQPTCKTCANAQTFAVINDSYLSQCGVNAVLTGISVDAGEDMELVLVSANLQRLCPSVVLAVIVVESGYAKISAFTH